MTPYMSFVIESFAELLGAFQTGKVMDHTLWLACMETLSKSLSVDEGGTASHFTGYHSAHIDHSLLYSRSQPSGVTNGFEQSRDPSRSRSRSAST